MLHYKSNLSTARPSENSMMVMEKDAEEMMCTTVTAWEAARDHPSFGGDGKIGLPEDIFGRLSQQEYNIHAGSEHDLIGQQLLWVLLPDGLL
jgi:hypothetical protein